MQRLLLFFVLIGLLSTCSAGGNTASDDVELARVGNRSLTLSEARNAVPNFMLQEDSVQSLMRYRKEWVRKQLLLKEAESRDIERTEEVQHRLQNAREEILTNALKTLVITQFNEDIDISDQELLAYYQKNESKLLLPEPYVKFRHIETEKLSEARAAREALETGVYWPDIASRYSLSPDLKIEQSASYWPLSTALPNLSSMRPYLTQLDSGAVSPVQRELGNYHFIQLVDFRAEGEGADPTWIEDDLRRWLRLEKQDNHYKSYVKNLYFKAKENNEITLYDVFKSDTLSTD